MPVLLAALRVVVLTWTPHRTAAYSGGLMRRVAAAARQLGFVVPPHHAPHIVGLRVAPLGAADTQGATCTGVAHEGGEADAGAADTGMAASVTAGAPPGARDAAVATAVAAAVAVARGLRSDGVLVSVRHGAIRISVGTYTTEREVDRLVASLRRHAPGHLPRAAPAGGGALPGASSKL